MTSSYMLSPAFKRFIQEEKWWREIWHNHVLIFPAKNEEFTKKKYQNSFLSLSLKATGRIILRENFSIVISSFETVLSQT